MAFGTHTPASPIEPDAAGRFSLDGLIQMARRWGFIATPAQRKIASVDDIGSIWEVESSLNWLIPDLLPEGSINLICSESGTGKTWLAYDLAGAVAHGRSVFGKQVAQRKVLYVDGENPAYVVKQRLHDLGIEEINDLKVWGGWEREAPPGPHHPVIREFAADEKPLIIWDSLVQFHTGDEQSATETRRFMNGFRVLAQLGATVVILHHTGKSDKAQEYRGSSDIKAAVDMAFTLESRNKGAGTVDELILRPFKTRQAPLPTRLIKLVKGKGFELSGIIAQPVAARPDPVEVIKGIVASNQGLNKGEIVKLAMAQGVTKHPAEAALERRDVFRAEKGKGRASLYYLAEQVVAVHAEGPAEEVLAAAAQADLAEAEAPAVEVREQEAA